MRLFKFEATSQLLKMKGNRVKQCQVQKAFVYIKAKMITLNNPIWVQIQAHKNKEQNKKQGHEILSSNGQ